MSTTLAKVKRNGPTTEAALDALLIARQWGYADDTRRISVMQSDGVTLRRFWDATRLADQTATYGTALIGTQGITGVTPSGGSSGAASTLQAMLTGLATASTGYIFNGTGVQASSNFNISGSGAIGGILTLASNLGFTNASDITIPDNQGAALTIKEAGNPYLRFVTTNGSESIALSKAVSMSSTLGVTGTTTLTGNVGIGTGPATSAGLEIASASLVGTSQYGFVCNPVFGTGATTLGSAGTFKVTNSGSFTMGAARALHIISPTLGASTVTELVGLEIATQTGGGTNYAIRTGNSGLIQLNSLTASSAVATDASKNLISVTNTGTGNNVLSASPTLTGTINAASQTLSGTLGVTGATQLTGRVQIGTSVSGNKALGICEGLCLTQGGGTTQYGLVLNPLSGTDATVSYTALYINNRINALTTDAHGLRIVNATIVGGAVANNYGLLVDNQSGGTNNWAIKTGTGLVSLGDNVTIAGTLGVTGVTTLANTLQRTASGEFLVQNTNNAGGSTGGIRLYTSSGDIKLEAVGGVNLTGSTGVTVTGNTAITGTTSSSGIITATSGINSAGRIEFSGNITGATKQMYLSSQKGVSIYGGGGSENDFSLFNGSGQAVFTNATGTQNVVMYGHVETTGALSASGLTTFANATSTTAGGAVGAKFGISGVTGLYFGSGAPTVSAPQGSLYLRTDGSSTSSRAYINTNGSTTWTAITTAA